MHRHVHNQLPVCSEVNSHAQLFHAQRNTSYVGKPAALEEVIHNGVQDQKPCEVQLLALVNNGGEPGAAERAPVAVAKPDLYKCERKCYSAPSLNRPTSTLLACMGAGHGALDSTKYTGGNPHDPRLAA